MIRTWLSTVVVAFVVSLSAVQAQRSAGTLAGTITRQGQPVPTADVEATSTAGGPTISTRTDAAGRYSLSLPPGTYVIVVPPLGFSADRFEQKDQVITAGQTTALDISLKVSNLGVVGDDAAFVAIRAKYAHLQGPAPRLPDGKPDLNGVWNANVDPNPQEPPLQPWAEARFKQFVETEFKDLPSAYCLPDDPAWTAPLLYRIVQTPSIIVMITEADPHYRQIFMDGRSHPTDLDPTWMGHSIGRWEGDTLVVDTVGFNDRTTVLYMSLPHTEQLRVVERFTRIDLARIKHEVTVTDPGAFTKPIVWNSEWQFAPGEEIMEAICNENNRYHENITPR